MRHSAVPQAPRTLRPVQDGSRRYGGAVTFCQIDALDRSKFAQAPVGRIQCGALGCHTYNRQHEQLLRHSGTVTVPRTPHDGYGVD